MITINDIDFTDNKTIGYIDDNNICYQFDSFEPMTREKLNDAKTQFVTILNLSRDRESIEKHMTINGHDGVVAIYQA